MEFDFNSIQSKARAVRDTQYMSITRKQAQTIYLRAWKKVQKEIAQAAAKGKFEYNLNIQKYLGVKAADSIRSPDGKYSTVLLFELGDFLKKKLQKAGFEKVRTTHRCCNNTYCSLDGYNLYVFWVEDEDKYHQGGKQRKNV